MGILGWYLKKRQRKKELRSTFSKKVSPEVLKEILKNSKDILKSQEREITILFSDIRAFTTISESIKKPSLIISLLNCYFTPMVQAITSNKGTVDKFIGDAIMAYWNAPNIVSDHPDKALESAIAQVRALKRVNQELKEKDLKLYFHILETINANIKDPRAKYQEPINIGIGINSGVATIGEIGSKGRSDYTAIGDSVNLASRLEGLCRIYGVSIIISEHTKNLLKKNYLIRELDIVKVKGKTEALKIYEILTFDIDESELKCYNKALRLYQNGDFQRAYLQFVKLTKKKNRSYRLYKMYKKRCASLKSNPPKEWNGIFEFKTK